MAPLMWIEVVSREGVAGVRQRVDGTEARIGRAFDNDVVVEDPHVAAHHVRIFRDETGRLMAEDLGSLNGLYPEHGSARAQSLVLGGEGGFRIGRTLVRVRDAAHPVPPEKPLIAPRAHAAWALGITALLVAVLLGVNWLDLTKEPNASTIMLPILGLATALALWAGLWALISRVFYGQAQFALQLRIAVTASVALVIWDQLAKTFSFALAWREMADYSGIGAWALLGATCTAHLYSIGPRHMRAAMGVMLTLLAAGAGIQYFGKSEVRQAQVVQRASVGELRPPQFRLVPSASADEFFQRVEATREKVDRAREKEPKGSSLVPDLESSD